MGAVKRVGTDVALDLAVGVARAGLAGIVLTPVLEVDAAVGGVTGEK